MVQSQTIVALVPDLMFSIRVRDVLQQLGYAAVVVDRADQAREYLQPDTALLIVDLRSPLEAATALVHHAKTFQPPIPVLAFGSHVDVARQQAARVAGCDRVVANSKFSSDLPALVQQMVATQHTAD